MDHAVIETPNSVPICKTGEAHLTPPNNLTIPRHGETRSSRASNRRVSTLSPDRLIRKRINDREAQRVARQRTKNYIDSLQKQIQDLEEKSAAEKGLLLAEARRQNIALTEELTLLKNQVAFIRDTRKPVPETNSVGILSYPKPLIDVLDRIGTIGSTYSLDSRLTAESCVIKTDQSPRSTATQPIYQTPIFDSDLVAVQNTQNPSLVTAHTYAVPTSFTNQPWPNFWALPVLLVPPENVIDIFLVNILHDQRQDNIQAFPLQRWSRNPSIQSLIYPDSTASEDLVSGTISKLVNSAKVPRLPEKIASLYTVYKIMQWQIRPCYETYANLPSWLAPRLSQFLIPHPCWVSQIKFPNLRDMVIERQDLYANNEFLFMYTTSLCVNWPWKDADIFKFKIGEIMVCNLFEEHILNLENWSLTEPFRFAYPELQWTCRFTSSETS